MGMLDWAYWNMENDLEEWAMIWKYNPTIVAKNLWANFGWVDKSATEHSGNLNIGNILQEIQWK